MGFWFSWNTDWSVVNVSFHTNSPPYPLLTHSAVRDGHPASSFARESSGLASTYATDAASSACAGAKSLSSVNTASGNAFGSVLP